METEFEFNYATDSKQEPKLVAERGKRVLNVYVDKAKNEKYISMEAAINFGLVSKAKELKGFELYLITDEQLAELVKKEDLELKVFLLKSSTKEYNEDIVSTDIYNNYEQPVDEKMNIYVKDGKTYISIEDAVKVGYLKQEEINDQDLYELNEEEINNLYSNFNIDNYIDNISKKYGDL